MPRYYFDFSDENGLALDGEGTELRDFDAVKDEAARCLADMTWDAARNFTGCPVVEMAVIVRDSEGTVLRARLSFEIDAKK